MRTHPVDGLLEQHCYKSAAGLLQLVCVLRVYLDINSKLLLLPYWPSVLHEKTWVLGENLWLGSNCEHFTPMRRWIYNQSRSQSMPVRGLCIHNTRTGILWERDWFTIRQAHIPGVCILQWSSILSTPPPLFSDLILLPISLSLVHRPVSNDIFAPKNQTKKEIFILESGNTDFHELIPRNFSLPFPCSSIFLLFFDFLPWGL